MRVRHLSQAARYSAETICARQMVRGSLCRAISAANKLPSSEGCADARKAVPRNPVEGDRLGKMALVLLQEIPSLVVRSRNESCREVQLIDHQDDFNRRVGLGGHSVERLPGDDLSWLAVVLQRKVLLSEAGDRIAVLIRHHNIEPDYSLGGVRFNVRRCSERGLTLLRK